MVLIFDVVKADVPFLIGLDVLNAFKLVCNTVKNKQISVDGCWEIPIVKILGHVCIQWNSSDKIFFTKAELHKLHCVMYHSPDKKNINLIKRSEEEDLDSDRQNLLEELSQACKTCQHLQMLSDFTCLRNFSAHGR